MSQAMPVNLSFEEQLSRFETRDPEIIFEWNDKLTNACGWLVIDSLRNGAAGGGTRMRPGLNKNEVISLAKTMAIKFTVSGPKIGGAKSGINFDPSDPRKAEVLNRWYKAVTPILKSYYGTGGDMNVDEVDEVIPITETYGLWHPQQGIVNGYYKPTDKERINKLGQLRVGVKKIIEDPRFTPDRTRELTIADMITGYGVACSVLIYYKLGEPKPWKGKRVLLQGWGNVGASAGFYLDAMGFTIVGIRDKDGAVIKKEGFSTEEVKSLFLNRVNNKLVSASLITHAEANKIFWSTGAEIFIPAAGSRLIDNRELDLMLCNGLEVIASGANVPFNDKEIFYGPTLAQADRSVSVIPDFIANCGMARVFAYLMQTGARITDEAIFSDVAATIKKALKKIHKINPATTGITQAALQIALHELN
jgi:glutamate dehydrogenase/leucine dehydrogenase